MSVKLSHYKLELPTNLISLYPNENRDESRLMVIHKDTGKIEHKLFKDIVDYFEEGDVMVANDTKVFPARLYGNKEKTGADIEVFLLRELNPEAHLWDVLVDPARKIRVGNKLFFGNSELVAEVIDNTTNRGRTIRFLWDDEPEKFYRLINELGDTPLPKFIRNARKTEPEDRERFQTIFAEKVGAVAAPSAGLHYTKQLIKRLKIKGINIQTLTMHTGLGTFRGVDVEDLTKHKTDSEHFIIDNDVANAVNLALKKKKRIIGVGTSVIRSLESSVSANNQLKPIESWTDKFIFEPYEFKIANAMITNFHLPQSTLLMTACAFGGYDLIMDCYQEAIKEKYKFYTFGDAMLII